MVLTQPATLEESACLHFFFSILDYKLSSYQSQTPYHLKEN